jgi:hypothetical protein
VESTSAAIAYPISRSPIAPFHPAPNHSHLYFSRAYLSLLLRYSPAVRIHYFLKAMSARRSSLNADSSMQSSALLTPPKTPTTPKDTPFKPLEGDRTSLSMKRHRKRVREELVNQPRPSLSDQDLRRPADDRDSVYHLHQSKSLPILDGLMLYPTFKTTLSTAAPGSGCPDQRRRRWTLPSKAAPTKGEPQQVSAISIAAPPENSQNTNELNSPAMITLRRATSSQASRKMSLTFFPEPQFRHTKSGFLTYFLNTISSSETKPTLTPCAAEESQRRRSSQSASVERGSAQPSSVESAPSVHTEVAGIISKMSVPGQTSDSLPVRRCSTRYISNGLVYEVIWDENGSSTSTESPPSQPEPVPAGRRRSVAFEQLEYQLSKADEESRRQSQASQETLSRKSTVAGDRPKTRSGSLAEFLNFKLNLLANDGALQNLPRSKSFRSARMASLGPRVVSAVPEEPPGLDMKDISRGLEFFPPLRSRATTGLSTSSSKGVILSPEEAALAQSTTSTGYIASRTFSQSEVLGSLVGVSSHTRRKSTAMDDDWITRQHTNAMNRVSSRRSSAMIPPRTRNIVEDDTVPLLSSVGMLE